MEGVPAVGRSPTLPRTASVSGGGDCRSAETRDRRLAFRRLRAILCTQLGDRHMALGTVKWFNPQKGYGFIQPQAGGQDVLVHISAGGPAGLASPNEGQQAQDEIVTDRGQQSAGNLQVK